MEIAFMVEVDKRLFSSVFFYF